MAIFSIYGTKRQAQVTIRDSRGRGSIRVHPGRGETRIINVLFETDSRIVTRDGATRSRRRRVVAPTNGGALLNILVTTSMRKQNRTFHNKQ